mgnify:CR=1 FL=1
MNLDYESLRILAWGILLLALIGFAITEGISLGTCALLTIVSRNNHERNILVATVAPSIYLQQSWMIGLIAFIFAAWPLVYAVGFACLQALILPIIAAWLIRPFCLVLRNALAEQWLSVFDKILSYSNLLAILGLGLILGNVIKGIPFHLDDEMHIIFLGDIWALLNPFTVLVALCCSCLIFFHGALYLQLDCRVPFADSCRAIALKAGVAFLIVFILLSLWLSRLEGYHINSEILTQSPSNPLLKFVKRGDELWMDNYLHQFTLWMLPILVLIAGGLGLWFNHKQKHYEAFLSSCVAMACGVLTAGLTLFPFLLPSNRSLNTSLSLWDASTSQTNLSLLVPVAGIAFLMMTFLSRWSYRLPNQLTSSTTKQSTCTQHSH